MDMIEVVLWWRRLEPAFKAIIILDAGLLLFGAVMLGFGVFRP